MMRNPALSNVARTTVLLLLLWVATPLEVNFYRKSCPRAEQIIREQVNALYEEHGNTAVSWLRTIFHDCVVESCDASILLDDDPPRGVVSEKGSDRNVGMRNFKYVETIKEALENECPDVVSCADIVVVAARDGVARLGGPYISVKTGRFDSLRSSVSVVPDFLPLHNDSVDVVLRRFAAMGIDAEGTVALLGAHTVGRTHCVNLVARLYPSVDPTLDAVYAEYLKRRCPSARPDPDAVVYARNDRETPMTFDNEYFKNVAAHKGLLLLDQRLLSHPTTKPFVVKMAEDNDYFLSEFCRAFVLLSENKPLSSAEGNVRRSCRRLNSDGA